MAWKRKQVTYNPNVRVATEVIEAIDSAIQADQGNAYRQWLQIILPHMTDAYRVDTDDYRTHLGASVIGKECARAVYYGFRWFAKRKVGGRMLRLFNRGHLEEGRFIAMLKCIGADVYQQDEHGKQFAFSHLGGHIGGSGDGVGEKIPGLPAGTRCLLEFKTYAEKYFKELQLNGVREYKPEHYKQMQMNMEKMGHVVSLYMAVNKNNDELYAEWVPLNSYHAQEYLTFGEKIVLSPLPPNRISNTPGYYKCKTCEHYNHCHGLDKSVVPINCRTCSSSEAREDGTWWCQRFSLVLDKAAQIKGCEAHTHR